MNSTNVAPPPQPETRTLSDTWGAIKGVFFLGMWFFVMYEVGKVFNAFWNIVERNQ